MVIDVVVIGAGLAGLVCAQHLKQAGYQVVVVEKSRGVGGRLATRRLQGTCADHGVRYLNRQGKLTNCLIQALLQQDLLQPWIDSLYSVRNPQTHELQLLNLSQPYYANPTGLTAAAKFLATGLNIQHAQRAQTIVPTQDGKWQLTFTATDTIATPLLTRAVVLAIPAPQALDLLSPLSSYAELAELVQNIHSVEFDPCISVIATYPVERQTDLEHLPWQAVTFPANSELAWLSLESTKRPNLKPPVIVAQSTAGFARAYLEAEDLNLIGQHLLNQASALVPWLDQPTELQVHRWRYALVRQPLKTRYLATSVPCPLVCCGDWCGGQQVENALESGLAAACQISHHFAERPQPIPARETNELELMQQMITALSNAQGSV